MILPRKTGPPSKEPPGAPIWGGLRSSLFHSFQLYLSSVCYSRERLQAPDQESDPDPWTATVEAGKKPPFNGKTPGAGAGSDGRTGGG